MVPNDNVATVRKVFPPAGTSYTDLFGDEARWQGRVNEIGDLFAPDLEGSFIAMGQRMDFRGLDGMRRAFVEWLSPWRSYYDEVETVLPASQDRVVVLGRQHGFLRDSPSEVVAETAAVYLLRGGKIARLELYADRAEALEAAGLSSDSV